MSPNFLVQKFCGKTQFPRKESWRIVQNSAEITLNYGKTTVYYAVHSVKFNVFRNFNVFKKSCGIHSCKWVSYFKMWQGS